MEKCIVQGPDAPESMGGKRQSCTGSDGSGDVNGSVDGEYLISDCPLPQRFTALVRRPLHFNSTGQWAAALQVHDLDAEEIACVALAFTHHGLSDRYVTEGASHAGEDDQGNIGHSGEDDRGNVGHSGHEEARLDSSGSSTYRDAPKATNFRHVRTGSYCEDADLLQGPLDD